MEFLISSTEGSNHAENLQKSISKVELQRSLAAALHIMQ